MQFKNTLIFILMFMTAFCVSANSGESIADYNYRRNFLNFDHDLNYKGLIYKENGSDSIYVQSLFQKIIKVASDKSKNKWYRPSFGVSRHYSTFLLLSLVVAHHESNLMHFAKRKKEESCYFFNDVLRPKHPQDFSILEDKNSTKRQNAKYIFKHYPLFEKLVGKEFLDIKHCDDLYSQDVYQLMFGSDYGDVGLYMFNIKSHGDFFSTKRIFNMDRVIEKAINYLYEDNFDLLASNANQFSCLQDLEHRDEVRYFENLIRATWAGRYNSGNVKNACRFTNSNHKFFMNDVNFKRMLERFISKEADNIFEKYLPTDSDEYKAYNDLVANVFENKGQFINIERVIGNKFSEKTNDGAKQKRSEKQLKTYFIDSSNVNFRSDAKVSINTLCGNTKNSEITPIHVLITDTQVEWYKVKSNDLKAIANSNCIEIDEFYVHKSLVKVTKKRLTNKPQRIVNTNWVIAYDNFKKGNRLPIGNLGPIKLLSVGNRVDVDGVRWHEVLIKDYQTVWIRMLDIRK